MCVSKYTYNTYLNSVFIFRLVFKYIECIVCLRLSISIVSDCDVRKERKYTIKILAKYI